MSKQRHDNSARSAVSGGRGPRTRLFLLAALIGFESLVLSFGTPFNASSVRAEEPAEQQSSIRFEGYPDAPEISVVSRKDELFFFPCDQCHAAIEPNPNIRTLDSVHHAKIEHGRGQIWCMSCHDLEERNYLSTLLGERVDFDETPVICGGCHSRRYEDWVFGAHSKRVANWQGERTVYGCTHCHDPHSPSIKARAPEPAPRARVGLELEHGVKHEAKPVWESRGEEASQ